MVLWVKLWEVTSSHRCVLVILIGVGLAFPLITSVDWNQKMSLQEHKGRGEVYGLQHRLWGWASGHRKADVRPHCTSAPAVCRPQERLCGTQSRQVVCTESMAFCTDVSCGLQECLRLPETALSPTGAEILLFTFSCSDLCLR